MTRLFDELKRRRVGRVASPARPMLPDGEHLALIRGGPLLSDLLMLGGALERRR